MSIEDEYGSRHSRLLPVLGALVACLGLAALALGVLAYGSSQQRAAEVRDLRGQLSGLQQRMSTLSNSNSALATRVKQTDKQLKRKDAGIAPLAARVLKSVFTVQTDEGWYGAGFVAWSDDTGTCPNRQPRDRARDQPARDAGTKGGHLGRLDRRHRQGERHRPRAHPGAPGEG